MKRHDSERIAKFFALFAIYLMISLTFFTANAYAILNYEIKGNEGVQNYAKRTDNSVTDSVTLHVEADSNVSFRKGTVLTPMDKCVPAGNKVICDSIFLPGELSPNERNMSFILEQLSGTPTTQNGYLYLDGNAPVGSVTGVKTESGINFTYSFNEPDCKESGIGYVEINIEGRPSIFTKTIADTNNCTVNGRIFVDMTGAGSYGGKISYHAKVRDRVGNEYITPSYNLSGDFIPPSITNDFKIMRGSSELTEFSSIAEIVADIIVEIEDSERPIVYANLTSVNNNPALRSVYGLRLADSCTKVSAGTVYECRFNGIRFRPSSQTLNIKVTAKDADMNTENKTISKPIVLRNSAGGVSYVGPLKSHCTEDLMVCSVKSGMQIFVMEIDATSNFENSPVRIGVDSGTTTAFCTKNETWNCFGSYLVPSGVDDIELRVAESYDKYGNRLQSSLERTVSIDNIPPVKTRDLTASNNNFNNNCSVSGDELTLNVRVRDDSMAVRMYVNTSGYTTADIQTGECILTAGDEWDCTLIVKDFASTPPTAAARDVIIEDLAGNRLPNLKYTFNVCKTSTAGTPNFVSNGRQLSTPNIDRRTASLQTVRVLIPMTFDLQRGGSIVYMTVDRCTARDINGREMVGSGYFMPPNPNKGKDTSIMLTIGADGALLPEGQMTINCTVSARMQSGNILYVREEKENFILKVNTFNQPLGTIDNSTAELIEKQKEELRSISKRIEHAEKNEKILNFICLVSDILVKVDSILQAVKAAAYVVALILYAIPVTNQLGDKLWKIVNTVTSEVDQFVQKNVWPTGTIGKWWGYLWKYTCLLYSCKVPYTLSGWVDMISDVANGIKAASDSDGSNKINRKDSNCDTQNPPCVMVYKDGSSKEFVIAGDKTIETNYNPDGTISSTAITTPSADGGKIVEETSTSVSASTSTERYIDFTENPETGEVSVTQSNSISTTTSTTTTYDNDNTPIKSTTQTITTVDGTVTSTTAETTTYTPSETNNREINGVVTQNIWNGPVTEANKDTPSSTSSWNFEREEDSVTFKGITMSGGSTTTVRTDNTARSNINYQVIEDVYGTKTTVTRNEEGPWNSWERSVEPGQDQESWTLQDQAFFNNGKNAALYNSIDRHDWIINPYRSKYFDGMCGRAQTYNLKKERQLRCMYVQCLTDSQETGMPSSVCKDIYNVNDCLYLESAQYRLNPNIASLIVQGVVKQSVMFAFGWATQKVYGWACGTYVNKMTAEIAEEGLFSGGSLLSLACGLVGAALKWQEIVALVSDPVDVWNNMKMGTAPEDPATIYDYCKGGEVYAEYAE